MDTSSANNFMVQNQKVLEILQSELLQELPLISAELTSDTTNKKINSSSSKSTPPLASKAQILKHTQLPYSPFEYKEYPTEETLSEFPQKNKLRWQVLSKKDDVLIAQSPWFKCKDFLNDVVARRHGCVFKIYGLDNQPLNGEPDGVFLLLKNLSSSFLNNYQRSVAPRLKQDLDVEVVFSRLDEYLCAFVPAKLWTKTYYISLWAYLIRVCSNRYDYKDWEQLFDDVDGPAYTKEFDKPLKPIKKTGFCLPETEENVWFRSGHQSSETRTVSDYYIHNCGYLTWHRSIYGYSY